MRITLTGATGFVGAALCKSLAEAGRQIGALSRNPESAKQNVAQIERAWAWKPSEVPPLEAFSGVDAVIHLAGESVVGRWTDEKRQKIRSSRVEGTQNLVRALERISDRPRVLISASAIGYYGERGDQELAESEPPGNDFLAETSVAWERASQQATELGVRVVNPRVGIVLEKNGGALGAMLTPAKLGLTGPLGSGEQWWSWIHRRDLIRLIEFCLDHEEVSGPVNATAPGAVRQKDFAKTLGRRLHRPAFLPAPAFVLNAVLGEFSVELLSSKLVVPQAAEDAGFGFEHPELSGALADIL